MNPLPDTDAIHVEGKNFTTGAIMDATGVCVEHVGEVVVCAKQGSVKVAYHVDEHAERADPASKKVEAEARAAGIVSRECAPPTQQAEKKDLEGNMPKVEAGRIR